MDHDTSFELDQRLARDTVFVTDLALCRVLLMNDRRYPWLVLVPRRPAVVEQTELTPDDYRQLCEESLRAARVLKAAYPQRKLNTAALGNVVSQFHLHVLVREAGDPAWPGPVWGHSPAEPYGETELAQRLEQLRAWF